MATKAQPQIRSRNSRHRGENLSPSQSNTLGMCQCFLPTGAKLLGQPISVGPKSWKPFTDMNDTLAK